MKYMSKGAIWASCLATLVLFCACAKKTEQDASAKVSGVAQAPAIKAVEETFNFGKIKQGIDIEHIFKIKNTGTAELLIKKAKGS